MLQKIEDIHSLECELVKIEDSNTSTMKQNRSMLTTAAAATIDAATAANNRNEEVMGEIRNMLKEMISTTSTPNLMTVNNIYEEYSKSVNRRSSENGPLRSSHQNGGAHFSSGQLRNKNI